MSKECHIPRLDYHKLNYVSRRDDLDIYWIIGIMAYPTMLIAPRL